MGNIIVSTESDDYGYVQKSILGDRINNWAMNNYDAGLGYNKTTQLKQLLKKRACCTRQTDMSIALPTIDLNKSVEESIYDNYTKINIKIFNNQNELNTNCKFNNNQDDYLLPLNFSNDKTITATRPCQILYEGIEINADNKLIGLCDSIKLDRAKQSDSDEVIAYGKYDDDNLNVYPDCNCQNSLLKDSVMVHSADNVKLDLPADQIVQKFDKRCTFVEDNAYKKVDWSNTKLCINEVNTGSITVNKGSININQQNSGCSPEENMNVSLLPKSDTTPTSSSTSTSTSTSPSTADQAVDNQGIDIKGIDNQGIENKNKLNIILTIVLIVVLLIMFGLYKYFVH